VTPEGKREVLSTARNRARVRVGESLNLPTMISIIFAADQGEYACVVSTCSLLQARRHWGKG